MEKLNRKENLSLTETLTDQTWKSAGGRQQKYGKTERSKYEFHSKI